MSAANSEEYASAQCRDLTCSRKTGLAFWIVPGVLLAITAGVGGLYAALSWPPLLVVMGIACMVNARRCGRRHCYFTGPYFLLLAPVSLLYGLGVLPLGPHGWQWLCDAFLIGAVALCCIPEWLLGRYVARH